MPVDNGSPFATHLDEGMFPLSGRLDRDTFDRLLVWATRNKASDITAQTSEPIWAQISGKWRRVIPRAVTPSEMEMIARTLYNDNASVLLNSGRDLDPAYDIRAPSLLPEEEKTCLYEFQDPSGLGRVRFRVNITPIRVPGATGSSATIRTLPMQPIPVEKLGLEPEILQYFLPLQGMNLICGPTGSGKSTLMSSLVRWIGETPGANKKIIEYSKPIEYTYDGLDFPDCLAPAQTDLGYMLRPDGNEKGEGSIWAYAVRNALRRKPDIIILGEMRDEATMQAGLEAASTGHLLVSTLHTIGVPETIRRIVLTFPPSERQTIALDLLQVLNMVVTQLLPDRVGGGKVAVREFMVFDAKVRRTLENVDVQYWPGKIRSLLKAGKVIGQSMSQAAEKLFAQGLVSAETLEKLKARENAEEIVD